jgi:uncharacterized protein YprB with RNaseH-like and TPR domain
MAMRNKEELLTMGVGTYLSIKKALGIDMIADYNSKAFDPYVKKDEKSAATAK